MGSFSFIISYHAFFFPSNSFASGSPFLIARVGAMIIPATGISADAPMSAALFTASFLFLFSRVLLLIVVHSYLLVGYRRFEVCAEFVVHMVPEVVNLVVIAAE